MLLQKASSDSSSQFGLKISEFGIIGSNQWWVAIESGKIPITSLLGKISNVYRTGHNDFPQFDLDVNGKATSWEQYGNPQYYQVGNMLKIVYVTQELKKPIKGIGNNSRVVISVEAQRVELLKEPFDGFEKA